MIGANPEAGDIVSETGRSKMATKKSSSAAKKAADAPKRQTVGESIIEGLKEAIAWTRGENTDVRVGRLRPAVADVLNAGLSRQG